jgi:hypothetical protein
MPRRLQFIATQIERKRAEKEVLSALLKRSDLPGDGWAMRLERTWLTGQIPKEFVELVEHSEQSPEAIRAGDAGRVSAMRVFGQNARGGLTVRVTPLLSPGDAQAFTKGAPSRIAKNGVRSSARVMLTSESTVEVREIPGTEDVWCQEWAALTVHGDRTILVAAGRVDAFAFMVGANYLRDKGSWDELLEIAAIQAQRLHQPPDR